MLINIIFVFILGLCVGSFLGVLIYRELSEEVEPRKEKKLFDFLPSWFYTRSYCDSCKKQIAWHDNIPLLSFVLLGGRCRYCRRKIPFQYPLIELLTGIEFVWVYLILRANFDFFARFEGFYSFAALIFWMLVGALFIMLVLSDLKYQMIPDSGIAIGILLVLAKIYITYYFTGFIDWSVFPSAFFSALFFYSIILITKGKGMGFGDVKLAFLLGLLLGFPNSVLALFLSFLTGGFVGVILLLTGRSKLKDKLAFGPFLVFSAIVSIIWGSKLITWYINLLI